MHMAFALRARQRSPVGEARFAARANIGTASRLFALGAEADVTIGWTIVVSVLGVAWVMSAFGP